MFSSKDESVQNVSWIHSYSTFNNLQLLFITFSRVGGVYVTYKRVLDWMTGFIDILYIFRNDRQLQGYRYFQILQFTVTPTSVLGLH
jgi:hypothetical protein